MLSVANVRTAGGAANYFAADNYYTRADADRSGEWFGQGAKGLGLDGRVEAKQFEAILKGYLPDGTRLGSDLRPHRAGTDLTFSMPKSWSLIALVGGDTRIIDVYAQAVKETLGWAEKHLAETRMEVKSQGKVVATGNLLVAMFRHDTNRNQEPNAHFHAVVANATKGTDGKWRALKNDKLWEHNTLLNAMTMARFRLSVEKLGYEVGEQGKHGNFEAKGVPKEIRDAFSSRRAEIVGALSNMDSKGLAARNTANLITRKAKAKIEDRAALSRTWAAKADQLGFDPSALIARANARAASDIGHVPSLTERVAETAGNVRDWATGLAERLGLSKSDPLIPRALGKRSKEQVAAIHAVASAVRHLGEREAVFAKTAIYKVALDFGLPTALPQIEERIAQLLRQGHLVAGKGTDRGMVTSADALALEQRIINAVDEGRNRIAPIVAPDIAGERLQALSELKYGMTLNYGQEGAGRLILSSHNRIVAIQGIAGAGKSTVLKPVADILREERREVLGLAVQNTLVQMLERDTGIASMTVARFLKRHASLLSAPNPLKLAEARAQFRGSVLFLDEASMVGNADKEKLVRLANLLEVDRFASIGDRKQLGAVDAGKPFDVMQKAGVDTAIMNLNIRARDKTLRAAQHAAQGGNVSEALNHLKRHIVEVKEDAALAAASAWLSLSPAERERTSIYASGRNLRTAVNEAVQTGLKANGELGKEILSVETLSRVNVTREELRYAKSYAPGMLVEVARRQRTQGLHEGRYRVASVDAGQGSITLENQRGKQFVFRPGQLRPQGEQDPLRLFESKPLDLHQGDRIRWTDTDHRRGLLNADQAHILGVDAKGLTVRTSTGIEQRLGRDDPMLQRLDLAYALNAHMAQGLTSDRGIAVMDSREKNLSNQQTFLVTITRLRDGLTLFLDNRDRLQAAVERNSGMKTSALEATGMLKQAAAAGLAKGQVVETDKGRAPPERDRSIAKPFEIGL